MRLAIDLDGVVCNFDAYITKKLGECDHSLYSLEARYPDKLKEIQRLVTHRRTYSHLYPIPGALWGLDQLYKAGHKILFCTARPIEYRVTEQWLANFKIQYFDLYQGKREEKAAFVRTLNPDVVIEDSADIAEDIGLDVILYSQPWNQESKLPKMKDWVEIVDYIQDKDSSNR